MAVVYFQKKREVVKLNIVRKYVTILFLSRLKMSQEKESKKYTYSAAFCFVIYTKSKGRIKIPKIMKVSCIISFLIGCLID